MELNESGALQQKGGDTLQSKESSVLRRKDGDALQSKESNVLRKKDGNILPGKGNNALHGKDGDPFQQGDRRSRQIGKAGTSHVHRNIAVFIPHMGCPHRCVFCNQHSISGSCGFDEDRIPGQIEQALQTIPAGTDVEIAYFGGSFTGIDRGQMIRLLDLAAGYVREGKVSGIRFSTRPDMIDREVLGILMRYPIRAVELGLQSMDDRVLDACRRGHTVAQAEEACRLVTEAGLTLVGQMMIGLPDSTPESECRTADRICRLGATAARIYPTVVFRDTPLADRMRRGEYRPLSVGEAVSRSADVLKIFCDSGVACLRIGLCASESLTSSEEALAGANHPALGEMVWSELYYRRLLALLKEKNLLGRRIELILPAREISKWVGHRRCNLVRLMRESGTEVCKITGDRNAAARAIPLSVS